MYHYHIDLPPGLTLDPNVPSTGTVAGTIDGLTLHNTTAAPLTATITVTPRIIARADSSGTWHELNGEPMVFTNTVLPEASLVTPALTPATGTVQQGESLQFSFAAGGYESYETVAWSVDSALSAINGGLLTVGEKETAKTLTVTARVEYFDGAATTVLEATATVDVTPAPTPAPQPEPTPTPEDTAKPDASATAGTVTFSGAPTGTLREGDRFTLVPSHDDRSGAEGWQWDAEYFSATFNSPATFTALKAGTSTITYTAANGATGSLTLTVEPSASGAVAGPIAQTGDASLLHQWAILAGVTTPALAYSALYRRKTRVAARKQK